jgi:Ca2+-binding RTX toxin-like protein
MAILRGTTGNDNLVGTDLNDFIYGGAGDDTINGGAGNDKLAGEDGNDTFLGGAGADTMSGGAGIDTADYSYSRDPVNVSLRSGTGSGGDAQGDTLGGIENLIGSNNHYTSDTLTGDSGNNILDGRNGSDFLFGSDGNDTLIGGHGNDTMSGGADTDTFVFHTFGGGSGTSYDGNDVITDFQVGVDVLEFTTIGGEGINSLHELSFAKVGHDTVISFGASSVTLVGVGLEQLMANAAHDFLFV